MEIWQKMRMYSQYALWPEFFNKNCGYCPIKDICKEYKANVYGFADNFLSKQSVPLHEKYELVKLIRKAAENAEEDLRIELAKLIEDHGGTYKAGDIVYTLKTGSRREISYTDTIDTIHRLHENGEIGDDVFTYFVTKTNELFSVKLAELDRLIKLHPKIKEKIEPQINRVPNSRPSIEADKVRDEITK
jgi:hypothetical protein